MSGRYETEMDKHREAMAGQIIAMLFPRTPYDMSCM